MSSDLVALGFFALFVGGFLFFPPIDRLVRDRSKNRLVFAGAVSTWEALAAEHDLEARCTDTELRVQGRLEDDEIALVATSPRLADRYALSAVLTIRGVPRGVTIRATRGHDLDDQLDILTGHDRFDTEVHISGDDALPLSRLGAHDRAEIHKGVQRRMHVEDGVIRFRIGSVSDARLLADCLTIGRSVARLLRGLEDGRFEAGAAADATPEEQPRYTTGLASLQSVLALLDDPSLPRSYRGETFANQVRSGTPELVSALVARVLADRSSPYFDLALDAVAARRLDEHLPFLLAEARRCVRWHVQPTGTRAGYLARAARLARALESMGSRDAEPVLFELVNMSTPEVSLPALHALGEIATLDACEGLQSIAEANDDALGAAARRAVLRIQQRAGPADAGALSLAAITDDTGAVSLAGPAAEDGALSLARPPLPKEAVADPPRQADAPVHSGREEET